MDWRLWMIVVVVVLLNIAFFFTQVKYDTIQQLGFRIFANHKNETRIDRKFEERLNDLTNRHNVEQTSALQSFYDDPFTVHECEKALYPKGGTKPGFLVAGVHKGGSTALFGYLTRHGHIRPSVCKEINFFTIDSLFKQGFNFYLRHFPDLAKYPHVITGEGTPNYIRDPYAPKRIKKRLPDVKIIVSLRDPTERMVSHFVGQVENAKDRKPGKSISDCNDFIKFNFERLNRCMAEITKTPFPPPYPSTTKGANTTTQDNTNRYVIGVNDCKLGNKTECLMHKCFTKQYELALSRSVYVDQLERWLHFYPAKNIYVVQSERMFKHTISTMQDVVGFLGLREFNTNETVYFGNTFKGSSHMENPISQKCDRQKLREFFRPFNAKLKLLVAKNWPQNLEGWIDW